MESKYNFPINTPYESSLRITKREYFAAAALQGILAGSVGTVKGEEVARLAWGMADEMLKDLW